jgi:hypothetical protein
MKNIYVGLGAVFLVMIVGIVVGVTNSSTTETLTGASVYVEYYGVNDVLMETQADKLQTYIQVKQPSLLNMETTEGRIKVVNELISTAEFDAGLVELYQQDPSRTITSGVLDQVLRGAYKEEENIKNDLTCFKKIGENHARGSGQFGIFMISEFVYQTCRNMPEKLAAHVKHTFFQERGNRFLCSQENPNLFLIDKNTGAVNTEVIGC